MKTTTLKTSSFGSGFHSFLALPLVLAAGLAHGSLIVNGSFELGTYVQTGPNYMRLAPGSTVLTGWAIGGNTGVDWHTSSDFIPVEGNFSVDLNPDGVGTTGTLSQTFTTQFGQGYLLSFYLAGPNSAATTWPDPRRVQVDVAGQTQVFTQAASIMPGVTWGSKTMSFTANGASTTLQFTSPDSVGWWGPVLDQVEVTAVPAAPPLALLLMGGLVGAATRVVSRAAERKRQ